MALTINRIDLTSKGMAMWRNTTGKPIYMNSAQTETVEFGPDAAFLLVGPDGSLPIEDAKKFGLLGDGEEYDERSVRDKLAEQATLEMEQNNRRAMMESGHTKLGPNYAPVATLSDEDVAKAGLEADRAAEDAKEEEGLTPEAPVTTERVDDTEVNTDTKAADRASTTDKAVRNPERNK